VAPTAPKPAIIIAQLAGSGTADGGTVAPNHAPFLYDVMNCEPPNKNALDW